MADPSKKNRGVPPAPTPDTDIQQLDLDQMMNMVRRETQKRTAQSRDSTDGATSGNAQATSEGGAPPTAPAKSRATPDGSGAGPVAEPAPPALSPDEIMRRVRAEVRRRRGEADSRDANDAPPGSHEHTGTVGTSDQPVDLPPREPAIYPLPLKPEYSLHELLQFSDARFVDTVYRVILRRRADPEGRLRYLSALRSGQASKTEILGLIRFSKEGRHRGVHIDGLLLRFKLQQWRHLPVLGRCLGFAMAVLRLPRLATRLQAIEGHAARNHQALERFVDLNNSAIAARFDDIKQATVPLRAQIEELREDVGTAASQIAGVQEQLRNALDEGRAAHAELQQRLDGSVAQLQALDESLRAQRDEYGHDHHDVVNHLGAHDTMIKNLSVEGQRVQHGALEIQRQLIALLDRNMSPEAAPSDAQPATIAGDKVLAPQYVAFEDAFRGERDDIKQRVAPYLDTLAAAGLGPDSGLVLDLGCGRGEWLEVLAENGYTCRGVDLNSAMVADSSALGIEIVEGDAATYLHDLPDASVAAITAMHIVEHIPHNTLIRLLDQAWRVLIPGGVLILETPNPENLTVGACLFYLDPTHRNPIPPALLQWTVKERGFDEATIERLTAHRGNAPITHVADDVPAATQINQIIDWFTAAPDYAIVAKKPATETSATKKSANGSKRNKGLTKDA